MTSYGTIIIYGWRRNNCIGGISESKGQFQAGTGRVSDGTDK